MSKREWWGRGDFAGSGTPVGIAEISKKHLHVRGAVAMAHPGNPAEADAQFYITLTAQPKLDGKYAVFGRVISGMDVVRKHAGRRRRQEAVCEALTAAASRRRAFEERIPLDELRRIVAGDRILGEVLHGDGVGDGLRREVVVQYRGRPSSRAPSRRPRSRRTARSSSSE